ncbi:uncharacterized protein LOC100899386 [Galendromus occidentalis]|uniref:Uncharacterized protein LOC100899386 n=1 Tax=Galendromus occidentalis TaxID=34638 RepID=A0AAJ6VV12_9ACAR|nr:uncharacterized protein LOC100899386 [Galendromus occidentalis]
MLGIEPFFKDKDECANEELNKFFRETIKRSPEGRCIISLPFKPNKEALGSNRRLAENRLRSLLIQAKKTPKLLKAIDDEINDLLEQGFVEPARSPRPGEEAHYLPLLAVVKKAASSADKLKVRVVNDAGARSKDEAGLNDVLFQGENLIADILIILLRFRQLRIVITADIEKAYLLFEITSEHRTFLRFLWPLGIGTNPKADIREFQSCRLSFGLISAPGLHCAGIRHHLTEKMQKRPEHREPLEFITQHFYVDDILLGTKSIEEGKKRVTTLVEVFKAGCFPLKKFATSSKELGRFIQENYPDASVTSEEVNARFLGVRWNQQNDSVHIDVAATIAFLEGSRPTKRALLKVASQIFDPLGLVSPITIGFKVLLQRLWLKKLDWDVPLCGDELSEYKDLGAKLYTINLLTFERNFASTDEKGVTELHVFCDASLKGYGCVAYTRNIDSKGKIVTTLIMANARVAPLKGDWSIHRLELLGAVIAVRIAKKIKQAMLREFDTTNFWCDNACVLAWIRDRPDRWKAFVENRIKEIQEASESDEWRYIRSVENPADLLSRASALDSKELREFWIHGPSWLRSTDKPESHALNPKSSEVEVSHERRAQCFVGLTTGFNSSQVLGLKPLSSWPEAVRIIAYVLRWRDPNRNKFVGVENR